MIKKILTLSLGVVLLSACSTDPDREAAKTTKALVNGAADLIEDKGEAAFPELSGEQWYQGKQYVFVFGLGGKMWVHPARPELVGTIQMDLQDVMGTFIIKEFIKTLKDKNKAWVEYRWIEPGNNGACNKRSYIRKAIKRGGQVYIVGSGYCKTAL